MEQPRTIVSLIGEYFRAQGLGLRCAGSDVSVQIRSFRSSNFWGGPESMVMRRLNDKMAQGAAIVLRSCAEACFPGMIPPS